MDAKEAKKQILFAVPIILTNIFYNLIPTVSIMFTGHLGELEFASSTLAQSWATVTGYSFMVISFMLCLLTLTTIINYYFY